MGLSVIEVLGIVVATQGVAAALGAEQGVRKILSNLIGLSGMVWPFLGETDPEWAAGMIALLAASGAAKVIYLNQAHAGFGALARVVHIFTLYDKRRATPIDKRFDAQLLFLGIFSGGVAAATLWMAIQIDQLPVRWALAAWFGYSTWAAGSSIATFIARAGGEEPPRFHDQPIRSLSIAEFWNRRWNRIIGQWLEDTFYRPFARRRRPRLGIVVAFLASAALHFYFIYVPLGLEWALVIASFFVVQIVYLFVERALRVTRWSKPARRVWTFVLLAVASPLHMEPCLQLVERSLS